jgi:hypothetical protein
MEPYAISYLLTGTRMMSGVYLLFLFISGLYALILLRRPPAPKDYDAG